MSRPIDDDKVLDLEVWETPVRLTVAEWLDQAGSDRRRNDGRCAREAWVGEEWREDDE